MIHVDAGQLRTPVTVISVTMTKNANGFNEPTETDALGYALYVQWRNAHGTEVLQAQELGLRDKATLRCRYDARIKPSCIVRRGGEDWEVISVDNVDERGQWMELTVTRMEDAL